jgi:hypothetical protein
MKMQEHAACIMMVLLFLAHVMLGPHSAFVLSSLARGRHCIKDLALARIDRVLFA